MKYVKERNSQSAHSRNVVSAKNNFLL